MLTPTLVTAISALRDINYQGTVVPESYPLPSEQFSGLLQRLCSACLIEPLTTEATPHSYRLLCPYETINLFQLVQITGEPLNWGNIENEAAYNKRCEAINKLGALRQVINNLLADIRVRDF